MIGRGDGAPGIARIRSLFADPAVRWLAGARIISLVAAPIALYLLITRQPLSARGFYFIAINVTALGQLFETGMGTLVVQFAVRVRPSERGILRGAAERWFMRAAVTFLAIAGTAGTLVLADGATTASVAFLVPWAVVLVCTAAYVRLVPLICMLEGGGDTDGVQRMRAAQSVAIAAAVILGLWSGRGIGAAAWAAVAQLAVAAIFVFRSRRHFPETDPPVGRLADQYRREQARSAPVWIAAWLAPQLLTPAVMLFRGATPAGELGLHVALALAPAMLSVAWMHARYPRLGALVAAGALRTFDDTARHAFTQALLVFASASAALVVLGFAAPTLFPFLAGRVISPALLTVLLIGNLVIVVFQAMLAWFRAFADERFSVQVVIACTAMAMGGAGGAALGGAMGAAGGYAAVGVIVALILGVGFARLRTQRLASA